MAEVLVYKLRDRPRRVAVVDFIPNRLELYDDLALSNTIHITKETRLFQDNAAKSSAPATSSRFADPIANMADDEEYVTKPFKFVTGMSPPPKGFDHNS